MTVRTRFAPSPTGYLHIGGARTALFSWLHARKHGGAFILRIEDTDLERSNVESVNAILEGMSWLGLEYDEGPFYQTSRFDRYREVVERLLMGGHAYHCYCSREELEVMREEQRARGEKPRYDGRCRQRSTPREGVMPVVRFRNPTQGHVIVNDLIHGPITFDNAELDDLIIARSDGTPTYNLTVVVDDMDMAITHVVRGDDHINNTPRQINILQALDAPVPQYAHVAMILGEDGKKLSKRAGAASVMEYRDMGLLPEAVLNYLVRLGWSHGDQEIFALDEMVELFDLNDVNKAASALNHKKLIWLNQHYLKTSPPEHTARHLSWHLGQRGIDPAGGPPLEQVVQALAERSKTLVEMAESSAIFYREFEEYEAKSADKHLTSESARMLALLRDELEQLPHWDAEAIHATIESVAKTLEIGMGKVAQPLRVACTGSGVSPPIDLTLVLLGRDRTLGGIDRALSFIGVNEA